jgi:hypothetical protein
MMAAACSIVFALAATTAASAAPTRNAASDAGSATFVVHMTLNGAVRGSLTYNVVELDTPCVGGVGIGSAGTDGVPSPDGGHVKFNGAQLQYAINNASYKGPGTYPTSDFANSSAAISADRASESGPFSPANNSKSAETMTWAKNGSGSFVFTGWENGSMSRSLSGKFTWTCKS